MDARNHRDGIWPVENVAEPPRAAVVIGLGYGGLNAVRSLGRLGIPVHGVHRSADTPAATSRYLRSLRVRDLSLGSPESTVAWLCDLGEELGRPVAIPTDDAEALLFARHRERLQHAFRYPFVPHEVIDRLVNKALLHELCREHGAPTPKTLGGCSVDEAHAFAWDAGYPLVVKGAATAVTAVHDPGELDRLLRRSDGSHGARVLQELLPWRPSGDWSFHGYFDARSRRAFGMTAVKRLQHPRHWGPSVVAESMPNQALLESASQLFARIGYHGIVDCDYRYDPRDRTYKLLDANPRIGANFRTSVDSTGMDVARVMYLDLVGRRAPRGTPRAGRRWLLETDFPFTWSYVRAGALTTRQWLGSLRSVEELAWFARDDVRPFAAFVRGRLASREKALRRRVRRAPKPAKRRRGGNHQSCP